MPNIIYLGKIIEINKLGFGTLIEAEPLFKTTDHFVGQTFVFSLNKITIGYEEIYNVDTLKERGVEVNSIVQFTLNSKRNVTRIYPLVFRNDIKIR